MFSRQPGGAAGDIVGAAKIYAQNKEALEQARASAEAAPGLIPLHRGSNSKATVITRDDIVKKIDATDNTGSPQYSRTPARTFTETAKAQATQTVERQVNALKAKWANAPKIVVAFDMQDPRIPEAVRAEDLRQRSGGAVGTPEGFYYKGTAYLMSSQLVSLDDTARVLFHEVLGHAGLRGLFSDALKPILQQIATMRKAEVDAKIKEYGLRGVDALDRLTAAEEVLAEMAQATPNIGFVKRAIAAIRTWLRANVPGFKNLALTDAEIIRSYILPAREFVTRQNQTVEQTVDRAMSSAFARAKSALQELAATARTDGNVNKTVVLGQVSAQEADLLRREGVAVDDGFTHTADMFAVRHTLNRHGDAKVEAKQGQLMIGDGDISAIPLVVNAPDALLLGAKIPRGQDIVGSLKRLPDGTVLYLEEVRSGRRHWQ